ncbi:MULTISPECIES: high light inducible protein [unclassified Synechococcus]|uniref:high light inducible protein n=1 Tax=unclassified Synechococcus TaxID=2626047 RepID=UPI001CF886D6|nr:high light inducible protein [Synechococcus sp. MU1650]MCB4400324.1 high light inducible protein [Synechococcus sp. MU1625]
MDQLESRSDSPAPVEAEELNAWKRGFTPQAEIWNGRLAMIGLSAGIAVVLLVRVFSGG